jgi:hypothetical protein
VAANGRPAADGNCAEKKYKLVLKHTYNASATLPNKAFTTAAWLAPQLKKSPKRVLVLLIANAQ